MPVTVGYTDAGWTNAYVGDKAVHIVADNSNEGAWIDLNSADMRAKAVLSFETQLAKASRTPAALRDPIANYHKMSVAELQKLAPHFQWAAYFSQRGVAAVPAVDVGQPEFVSAPERVPNVTSSFSE